MTWQIDLNVKSAAVRANGLVATFFKPSCAPPYPVVITLGGSTPGIFTAPGALLASQGIAVLAMAYFGVEHLPKCLKRIPLEYFGNAIDWCRSCELLRPDAIAVAGGSRGGELALLIAATYPEIVAVVGWSASGVLWAGIDPELEHPAAAWSHCGGDLPFLQIDRAAIDWEQRPVQFAPGFSRALADDTATALAAIPVERINGPVLLISGTDDRVWPSQALSNIAVNRLRRLKHPFVIEHLCYEGAGHGIGPPHPFGGIGSPTHFVHPLLGLDFDFGGSPDLNAKASGESWVRVVGLLKDRFASLDGGGRS
jgi:pimeloyl-ACP methyl ester carboxylesterase